MFHDIDGGRRFISSVVPQGLKSYPSQEAGLIAVVIERLRNAHMGSLFPLLYHRFGEPKSSVAFGRPVV
jgi:hypothetical protein